jgi:hypothetical protein
MTTRRGQFAFRGTYTLIKREFDRHGIKMDYPTMTVAGDMPFGGLAAGAISKLASNS